MLANTEVVTNRWNLHSYNNNFRNNFSTSAAVSGIARVLHLSLHNIPLWLPTFIIFFKKAMTIGRTDELMQYKYLFCLEFKNKWDFTRKHWKSRLTLKMLAVKKTNNKQKPGYARLVYVIQTQFKMHRKACFKVQLDYKITKCMILTRPLCLTWW